MPRPKRVGAPEPKRRSRTGCWPCKTRKVKCDEARPVCVNCQRQGETCDYSIRLNWDGRGKKKGEGSSAGGFSQIRFSTPESVSQLPQKSSPTTSRSANVESATYINIEGVEGAQKNPLSGSEPPSQAGFFRIPPPAYHSDSMIDPNFKHTGSQIVTQPESSFAQPRFDFNHTQIYERYHANSPNPGAPATLPAVSKLCRSFSQDELGNSPTETCILSPNLSSFSHKSSSFGNLDSPISTTPFYCSTQENNDDSQDDKPGYTRPPKRIRYQPGQELTLSAEPSMPPPILSPVPPQGAEARNSSYNFSTTSSTPLTPASSHSDDGFKGQGSKPSPRTSHDSPDVRRLSVNSLLSGPPGIPYQSTPNSNPEVLSWPEQYQDVYQDTNTWGIDRGIKDLDIGKNDDMNAISGSSPAAMRDHLELVLNDDGGFMPVEFGFGMEMNNTVFENGGYYDKPVSISIPRALEPLPSKLLENPMNLLYFHHFLNHTAGCLIPHNCSSNPFKSILPRMAVQDDNLLNLLLAYSASHRARLLRQPEPATRIALWVQDIFPNLRKALDNPDEIISNANLATAIMLASLEIISPKAFGVAVPWQKHLDTARQIIAARGGPRGMHFASRRDKVASFLWSWFAYLDVLGSLSGPANASSAWILDYEIAGEDEYNIDCILGFTSKCVRILAKIAELARVCDGQRIRSNLTIDPDWRPSEDTIARADKLEADLSESRLHPSKPCTHMQSSGEAAYQWDSIEMSATNEAFHWAGLVHLHRRILGKPSSHPDVQQAVREIHGALCKVRRGGSAEACLLFPMFTAGCDTEDKKQKMDILERLKGVERFGMTQVHKARTLMERAWETGNPWETLIAGEFFG
ncbi:fungal-specific transcription factor domain-containing protein [Tricladium varicosporioides]|nr:fungal-specific transcription factor domain-containing protein [Hymenoscyphus varicosporioides]